MPNQTRQELLKQVEERIKAMVKDLLEAIMREERAMYLEEHPTKANGYYTRDLLTLVGPVEDLRVPRVREG
ncbi:MAG: transposase, partial [Armatimonadota bacterium]|nr:transposase [Armatimonadota bacterium]